MYTDTLTKARFFCKRYDYIYNLIARTLIKEKSNAYIQMYIFFLFSNTQILLYWDAIYIILLYFNKR